MLLEHAAVGAGPVAISARELAHSRASRPSRASASWIWRRLTRRRLCACANRMTPRGRHRASRAREVEECPRRACHRHRLASPRGRSASSRAVRWTRTPGRTRVCPPTTVTSGRSGSLVEKAPEHRGRPVAERSAGPAGLHGARASGPPTAGWRDRSRTRRGAGGAGMPPANAAHHRAARLNPRARSSSLDSTPHCSAASAATS